jgi:glucans biosynthesis protein C
MTEQFQPLRAYAGGKMETSPGKRLSGIDALRAVAMLLGVFFHATIAYRENQLANWPYDDTFHHWSFDFLYLFIHSFRMPLFFLIAGYFCRLLYFKIGEKEFIRHRVKRILVPFAISLVVILPFTIFPFLLFHFISNNPGQWGKAMELSMNKLFQWNGMAHLWFLYYLLIYYVAAIALLQIGKRLRSPKLTQSYSPGHIGIAIGAIIAVWLVLLTSSDLYLHVDTGILPQANYLLFYAIFFYMGWLMHKMIAPFAVFVKRIGFFLPIGAGLAILTFIGEYNGYFEGMPAWQMGILKLFVAVQVVMMVYGVIGFFLKYFESAGATWRYISDSSFWMYLIHLGVVAGMQILCMYLDVPGVLRFPLVLGVTVAFSLVTYHYFVRYSVLGEYLHGRREKVTPERVHAQPSKGVLR